MSRSDEVDQAQYSSEQRKALPNAKNRKQLEKFHNSRGVTQPFIFNLACEPADIYLMNWKE